MLDARLLAGDWRSVVERCADGVRSLVAADVPAFAEGLRNDAPGAARAFRLVRVPPGAGAEGAVAAGCATSTRFGWLAGRSRVEAVLRTAEREALDAAEEFLTRVRSALQLETGKRRDRLAARPADDVARGMGFRTSLG